MALCCGLLAPRNAVAQAEPRGPIDPPNRVGDVVVNYVYAAQFGLGGYSLGGVDVKLFTIPFRYRHSFANPVSDRGRAWTLGVHFPLKYGRYEFDADLPDGSSVGETQDTLAVYPGLELLVPVTERWTIKPLVALGFGRSVSTSSDWVYIWGVGVRSRYEYPWRRFTLLLGNALFGAGNETFTGAHTESFGALQTGLGVRYPLGFHLGRFEPDVEGMVIHHFFFPDAEFDRFRDKPLEVTNQVEFGASFGVAQPWQVWIFSDLRAGAAYRSGDGLTAIRVYLGFPF